ncbi:hypothetical protein ACTL32_11605 [Planococcus sp. FY231025]|uniref:hypothetical protein n=1 Tax=Planococcus sp. FY231025 TaxID=3455699 RepID=UPI003F8EF32A
MEKNNRDDSIRKDRQDTQQFQAADSGTAKDVGKEQQREGVLQERGTSDTNTNSSNEPYLADGDTTIRKKDPAHSADWRESEEPNPSRETSGWQKSNDFDDTIREPEGTFTTGERGNVINSATWDPGTDTSEENVEHVDVNDYDQNASPLNKTKNQPNKLNEDRIQREK